MIEQTTIDELKRQHPKTPLSLAELTFVDDAGNEQRITLVYRKPNVEEVARLQKEMSSSPSVASHNLTLSIVVKSVPEDALDILRTYPLIIDKFLAESILPLLGSGAEIRTRKL